MIDSWAISPFSWAGIGAAMIAGAFIGLERQLLGKPVGIRTSILICLGTYVFVKLGGADQGTAVDSTRIIGQIITGIGFLGAGVILARDGMVLGVTSAAAIWVLASIGSVIGRDHYLTGIKLSILTVLILVGIDVLEGSIKALQKGVHRKFTSRKDGGVDRE